MSNAQTLADYRGELYKVYLAIDDLPAYNLFRAVVGFGPGAATLREAIESIFDEGHRHHWSIRELRERVLQIIEVPE